MFIASILAVTGLACIGFAFYKVLTAEQGQDIRSFMGIALVGGIVAIAGVVFYIQSSKKEERIITKFTPSQVEERIKTLTDKADETKDKKPKTNEVSAIPPPRHPIIEEVINTPGFKDIFVEDPYEEPFSKEEIMSFNHQLHYMLNVLEEHIAEDMLNKDTPGYKASKKWFDLSLDMELYATKIRREALSKKGPGTGNIKRKVMGASKVMTNLVKRYTNSVSFNRPIDHNRIQIRLQKLDRTFQFLDQQIEQAEPSGIITKPPVP